MANKFYRAVIKGCDVHNIGCAALDREHAAKLIIARLVQYGLTEQQFTIAKLYRDKWCDWNLGTTIIYD